MGVEWVAGQEGAKGEPTGGDGPGTWEKWNLDLEIEEGGE
jgi:hypothetical protein